MSPSPQREPENLSQQIQNHVETRREEISQFVTCTLSGEARQRFVNQMENDRALRLAVMEVRASTPQNIVPLSAKAAQLIEQMGAGIRQGNMLFPGNPYIAGLENRPDMGPSRETHYKRTEAAANQLLQQGEAEDIALENRDRALNNIASGKEAQRRFSGYSPLGGFEGMLGSIGADSADRSHPAGAMLPAHFNCAPADFSKGSLQGSSLEYAKIIAEFDSLDKGREGRWKYQHFGQLEISPPSRKGELVSSLTSDLGFLAAINRSITEPMQGSLAPEVQIVRKLVGLTLLCSAAEATGDARLLEAPFSALENLIASAQSGALLDRERHLLGGYVSQLTLAAQSNDLVWNRLRPVLMRELNAACSSSTSAASNNQFPLTIYIEALGNLASRVNQDGELFNTAALFLTPPKAMVEGGSYDLKEKIVTGAIRAIAQAKRPKSVEILVEGLFNPDLNYSTECVRQLVRTDIDLTDFDIKNALSKIAVDPIVVKERFKYYAMTEAAQKAAGEVGEINNRLQTVDTFEELAVVALDAVAKLRPETAFRRIDWNLELINKFNPSRMEKELGKYLESTQLDSEELDSIAHFCERHKLSDIAGQLANAYLRSRGDVDSRGAHCLELLQKLGMLATELDQRFRDFMSNLSINVDEQLNLISKAQKIGKPGTILQACELTLQSNVGVSREHAMRTLRRISDQPGVHIGEDVIRRIIFLAERDDKINWVGGQMSEASIAIETLMHLARGPIREAVLSVVDEELVAREEGATPANSNRQKWLVPVLRTVSSLRDLSPYELDEALGTEPSLEEAFGKFISTFAARPKELGDVLNSFKYDQSDRIGPRETAAREAVVEALGEAASAVVFQYLKSKTPMAERTIVAILEVAKMFKV